MPGQFVAIKHNGKLLKRLHSVASTPYESRRDSSYISSSLIEVGGPHGRVGGCVCGGGALLQALGGG